jgi:succinoglycan biosynthesis protein ExoA
LGEASGGSAGDCVDCGLSVTIELQCIMADLEWPSVSVIMPIRNEAGFIEESLGAVLAQDYPGQLEALVVDGMSDDGTRQIVQAITAEGAHVRLLDNPHHIVPAAINLGAQAAHGEIIVRVDGRSIIPPDYVRRCVELLRQTGAWNVGGMQVPVARAPVGQVIAAAMLSPFGAGPAKFRFATQPQPVDTVYLGTWPRDVFLRVGGFDERLVRNQDYEFNIRLRQAGGMIYFAPDLRVDYYGRETLRGLWQQYLQYGIWKARVIKIHPASFRPRQGAAPALVAGLVIGLMLALLGPPWSWVYLAGVAVYLVAVMAFSVSQAARQGLRMWWLMPMVFLTLHLAWGLGFWAGVWRWWIRGQGSPQPKRS